MKKLRVDDLESYPINERRMCFLHLTPDAERCMDELSAHIIARLDAKPEPKRGLKKREVQKLLVMWKEAAPQHIKNRYQMMCMAKGFFEASKYWEEEFQKAHPESAEVLPQGRPKWYVHPSRLPRVARGEVLSRLINLAGEKLLRQLIAEQSSDKKSA